MNILHWCCYLILITATRFISTQNPDAITANPCLTAKTCGECVAAGPDCNWCITAGFTRHRCDYRGNLLKSDDGGGKGCDVSQIRNPDHDTDFVKEDPPRAPDDPSGQPVQLSPQELKIKLRPNKPYYLNVTFRLAEDYPVDLYYLMDLSNSMDDDKKKLALVGDDLARTMNNITRNFRLGFGSFVDKTTMPYVSIAPGKLESPCVGCAPPYGFKNQLPLTEQSSRFKAEVNAAPVSGNLDGPEGGFDAIMQAMACGSEIGWRKQSRKMLMFSTDADFHYAGDGKLGGIVEPNDGLCHMENGNYTYSLKQDYPSIGQIAAKAREERFNIIFAVTADQRSRYDKLVQYIEGSTSGTLTNDSSNVVNLVKKNYAQISSQVELRHRDVDELITVKFKSKCLGNTLQETNVCSDLKIKQNVTFETEIFVPSCPPGQKSWKSNFEIYPVGLAESLKIELDMICDCNCGDQEVNSPKCSGGQGTYRCGVCECNNDRYGNLCQCNITEATNIDREAPCKRVNTSDIVCENRGECICGECACSARSKNRPDQKYSGDFCECDNYACDFFDNQLCGGSLRGQCKCGQCVCNAGNNGTDCGCPTSQATCITSNPLEPLEICNGKGDCVCGECRCDPTTQYRGPTCEDCPTCPGKCSEYKSCVQCRIFGSGEMKGAACDSCFEVLKIDKVEDTQPTKGIYKCQFIDEDDCTFFFNYFYDTAVKTYVIKAQEKKECPEEVPVLAIVLGVIGGIVFIGLAILLIWKLLTTIHDRREFAKFEKERQNAKWDTGENPIYKQATSTFKNPTYAGKQ